MLDVTLLRIELLKRGITPRELARRCGISWAAIRLRLSRGFCASNQKLRYLIEDGFGYNFWSSSHEWKRRAALKAAAGFDPYFASLKQLREFASSRGIPWNDNCHPLRRAELLQTIASRLLQPAAMDSLTNTHTDNQKSNQNPI